MAWRSCRASAVLVLIACAQTDEVPSAAAQGGAAGVGGGIGMPPLSDAEWLALSGPQPGVHDVQDAACGGQPIAQEYRVLPSVACVARRDESGVLTSTRDCAVTEYCTTAADCSAQPRGVCIGDPSGSCEYADLEQGAACESDADCTVFPGGTCVPRIEGGGTLCYPTGECLTTPMQSCSYAALRQPCTSDADCSAAPAGSCQRTISSTECVYNECAAASDCGPGARCECFGVQQCIPADCFSDTDCGAGYRCEPSLALQCGNLNPPAGYHCHALSDDCQSDTDCDNASCVFDPAVSHWVCRDTFCLTR